MHCPQHRWIRGGGLAIAPVSGAPKKKLLSGAPAGAQLMAMAQDLGKEQPDGDSQLPGKLWAGLVQTAGSDRVLAAARDLGLFDPQVRRS
jgi:hypothetical protein